MKRACKIFDTNTEESRFIGMSSLPDRQTGIRPIKINFVRMKYIIIILITNFICLKLYAQPTIEWQRCLGGSNGDNTFSIKQTYDGGYIIGGNTGSNDGDIHGYDGNGDAWIVRLNSTGDTNWTKCYGGSGSDGVYSIIETFDLGYVFAGQTDSKDGDVHGCSLGVDFWVVKLDYFGDTIWTKCYGGIGHERAYSIKQTVDSGFIVAGSIYSQINQNFDCWIIKLDKSGDTLWTKIYGGSKDEEAYSIQQTSDGGYIFAGYTNSNDGYVHHRIDTISKDMWVVKLDVNGDTVWTKCLGFNLDDEANSIIQTYDGGYNVAGQSYDDLSGRNNGHYDFCIIKLNPDGDTTWVKFFGGTYWENATDIIQTYDSCYLVAGFSNSSNNGDVWGNNGERDFWIIKLNQDGDTIWTKCLGGSMWDAAYSIQETMDTGIVVAGFTKSNDGDVSGNHGDFDIWVVKLSKHNIVTSNKISHTISNDMIVYPNPTKYSITIKNENYVSCTLYTIKGTVILKSKERIIDLMNLPDGLYLLEIVDSDGKRFLEKIIKK
jgi:hypothetical protein